MCTQYLPCSTDSLLATSPPENRSPPSSLLAFHASAFIRSASSVPNIHSKISNLHQHAKLALLHPFLIVTETVHTHMEKRWKLTTRCYTKHQQHMIRRISNNVLHPSFSKIRRRNSLLYYYFFITKTAGQQQSSEITAEEPQEQGLKQARHTTTRPQQSSPHAAGGSGSARYTFPTSNNIPNQGNNNATCMTSCRAASTYTPPPIEDRHPRRLLFPPPRREEVSQHQKHHKTRKHESCGV